MLNRVLGEHQDITAEDVINICALFRQNVDMWDIACGFGEVFIEIGAVDDEGLFDAELREFLRQRLGLVAVELRRIE